jgi:hypothetical protein
VRFAVVIVSPAGYAHAEGFREVAETVAGGLGALGHDAVVVAGPPPAGRRAIVLGANLLGRHPVELPADAILYNLEQVEPGSPWFGSEQLDLFRRHRVWDYSARNAARLAALGVPAPVVVPIGYVPEMTRIAAGAEDIDVLFYGSMNPRRSAIVRRLRADGLRVEAAFGVYGAARDALIARAKVVLNVHFYEAKVFEVVRVSYLLANRKAVVSERGADPDEEAPFAPALRFARYDELARECRELVTSAAERRRLGDAGLDVMRGRPEAGFLAAALG